MSLRSEWKRVNLQGDSPWVIYRNRISRKRHVLVVFPHRDTSCFLANIPDSVPLSSLMLPGTHETMAFYGWPISQCQSNESTLAVQLHSGIRVIDIRLSIIDDRLISYHGIVPQRTPFSDILQTLYTYLTSPMTASETVVVSIKQENSNPSLFSKLVREEIKASPGGLQMWFLENRVPKLGEVRGKAVMFSRFGGDGDGWENGAIGIHPPLWPDSLKQGFYWECPGTLVQIQDWYAIPSFLSIPEKTSLSTEILIPPPKSAIPTLSISFLSASSIPFAFPPIIARGFGWPRWGLGFDGVNYRVGKWLLDKLSKDDDSDHSQDSSQSHSHSSDPDLSKYAGDSQYDSPWDSCTDEDPRIRGWVLMDYYGDPIEQALVPLFVECNFRWRRAKEEGW
ncbi:PLC-like phosphodiesterase [Melanogaster broomeanus]|nr:PLC-like phosphodiesterase [Melanogaster broomeanus]